MPILSKPYDALMQSADQILANPNATSPMETPRNIPLQANSGTDPYADPYNHPVANLNGQGLNPNFQMPQNFTDPGQSFNPADFGVSPYSYPSALQSTPTWGTNLGPNDLPVGLPYAPNRGPSLTPMAANVPTPDVVSNPFTNLPPISQPSYGGNLFGNSGYAQNSAQGYNNPYGQANPGVYVNNFSQQPKQSQSANPYQIYKQTLV